MEMSREMTLWMGELKEGGNALPAPEILGKLLPSESSVLTTSGRQHFLLRCHAPRSFEQSPCPPPQLPQEKPFIFLLVPNAYKSVTVTPTLVQSTKWTLPSHADTYFFDCPDVVRNAGEPTAKCGSIRRSALGAPVRAAITRMRDGGIT